jgi:DNA-binding beta-propeller fold protein YncE
MNRRDFLASSAALAMLPARAAARAERRLLYVAVPGIRNYVDYGGVGVLVYDIEAGHRFVRRIPTWPVPDGAQAENVKGVAASAATARLYVSTIKRLGCIDLASDRMLWSVEPEGGCDRMSITPDGRLLFVPSFEGPHWNVIDGGTGRTVTKITTSAGAHNTLTSADGRFAYLAGLRSPVLTVADARAHAVVRTVGPFSNFVRPFTVDDAAGRCYVNVNELLGFEAGDLQTGKVLYQVIVEGYEPGPTLRHGCPSHGIGLTPDGRELWLCDGHNFALHVFDMTATPPRQVASLQVRDQPGWITFSIDGRLAYPSSGEVFDTRTRTRVATLEDERGRQVGSEKLLEVVFEGDRVVRTGDQFGVVRRS